MDRMNALDNAPSFIEWHDSRLSEMEATAEGGVRMRFSFLPVYVEKRKNLYSVRGWEAVLLLDTASSADELPTTLATDFVSDGVMTSSSGAKERASGLGWAACISTCLATSAALHPKSRGRSAHSGDGDP